MGLSSIRLCLSAAHQLQGIALLLTRSLRARIEKLTSGAAAIFHWILLGILSSSMWPHPECTALRRFICVSLLHIQSAHVRCRPKPVVKLKQPAVAKSSSPAAALNAAWANFPMPTEFMAEEPGSFRMDWLSSADLGVSPPKPAGLHVTQAQAKAWVSTQPISHAHRLHGHAFRQQRVSWTCSAV